MDDLLFDDVLTSELSLATTPGWVDPAFRTTSSLSDLLLTLAASLNIPPRTSSLEVSKKAKSSKFGATSTSAIYYQPHLQFG